MTLILGNPPGEPPIIPKAASSRYWMKRGFASGGPASCNAWTAASSKVG